MSLQQQRPFDLDAGARFVCIDKGVLIFTRGYISAVCMFSYDNVLCAGAVGAYAQEPSAGIIQRGHLCSVPDCSWHHEDTQSPRRADGKVRAAPTVSICAEPPGQLVRGRVCINVIELLCMS